jgi:hypothetical protein
VQLIFIHISHLSYIATKESPEQAKATVNSVKSPQSATSPKASESTGIVTSSIRYAQAAAGSAHSDDASKKGMSFIIVLKPYNEIVQQRYMVSMCSFSEPQNLHFLVKDETKHVDTSPVPSLTPAPAPAPAPIQSAWAEPPKVIPDSVKNVEEKPATSPIAPAATQEPTTTAATQPIAAPTAPTSQQPSIVRT